MKWSSVQYELMCSDPDEWRLVMAPELAMVAPAVAGSVSVGMYTKDVLLRVEWGFPSDGSASPFYGEGLKRCLCVVKYAQCACYWLMLAASNRGDCYLPEPRLRREKYTDLQEIGSVSNAVSELDSKIARLVDELSENHDFEENFEAFGLRESTAEGDLDRFTPPSNSG